MCKMSELNIQTRHCFFLIKISFPSNNKDCPHLETSYCYWAKKMTLFYPQEPLENPMFLSANFI